MKKITILLSTVFAIALFAFNCSNVAAQPYGGQPTATFTYTDSVYTFNPVYKCVTGEVTGRKVASVAAVNKTITTAISGLSAANPNTNTNTITIGGDALKSGNGSGTGFDDNMMSMLGWILAILALLAIAYLIAKRKYPFAFTSNETVKHFKLNGGKLKVGYDERGNPQFDMTMNVPSKNSVALAKIWKKEVEQVEQVEDVEIDDDDEVVAPKRSAKKKSVKKPAKKGTAAKKVK